MALYAIKENKCLSEIALARAEETEAQTAYQGVSTRLIFTVNFASKVLAAAGCFIYTEKAVDSSGYAKGDVTLMSIFPSDAGGQPNASNPTCVTAIVAVNAPSDRLNVSCIISALVAT